MAKELNYYENGIYYNLALAYSHLENPYKALHFANIAIEDSVMSINSVM